MHATSNDFDAAVNPANRQLCECAASDIQSFVDMIADDVEPHFLTFTTLRAWGGSILEAVIKHDATFRLL